MITIDKDIKRLTRLLNTGNNKAVKNITSSFTIHYKARIYSNLNPFDQKLWDDMYLDNNAKI